MKRTVEMKVCTIQKTMIPVLSCKTHQQVENVHDIFCMSSFSSSNSSSPVAEECESNITTELCGFHPTAFLCILEVSAMQSVYDSFPASSYAAYW